jgi:C1A family cysteine protease
MGYEDQMLVPGAGESNPGAFLFRSCFGTTWGDDGYGWIPYDYIVQGAARDFWGLVQFPYDPIKDSCQQVENRF